MIYLDSASTTHADPACLDEMDNYFSYYYGNPGNIHKLGMISKCAIEDARAEVMKYIGAKSGDIIFTSSGTEANNLAILGVRKYLSKIGKSKVCISATEHESVFYSTTDNYDFVVLPVDYNGITRPDDVEYVLSNDDSVGLVSVMYVNNEVGSVNDVYEIAKICKKYGVLFHTDCVQAAGMIWLDQEGVGCDMLTISGHKINAPKGIGALYVRNKEILSPIVYGGESQEYGLRGGTENVPAIVALGYACKYANVDYEYIQDEIASLKNAFYRELQNKLISNSVRPAIVNCNSLKSKSKILSLYFDGVDSETLVLMCSSRGVYMSSGSACRGNSLTPNRVLKAIGFSDDYTYSVVRFSFSLMSVENAIKAASIVADCVIELCGDSGE